MAKTTQMRLIELMVLKQDIEKTIEFLGRKCNFQFQTGLSEKTSTNKVSQEERKIFAQLQSIRAFLNVEDRNDEILTSPFPSEKDYEAAESFLQKADEFRAAQTEKLQEVKKISNTYTEAKAFANLKASYDDIEHLSFLSLKIGKIDPDIYDDLINETKGKYVVVPLGQDNTKILAAASKKGRFQLDTILKKYNFVKMEVPKNFKGVPESVLENLRIKNEEASKSVKKLEEERKNFAEIHQNVLLDLLGKFSVAIQVKDTEMHLQSTKLVYRLTGWIPSMESRFMMTELDKLTEGRIAIRQYKPGEVPSVISGEEKVPVLLRHGKIIGSFERMVFSYGSPVYGTVDPTPYVAVIFTLLFGIMFGDAGQGLVFLLAGILMAVNVIKIKGWNKFAPIFILIGSASVIMGLLTGEFFSNESLLLPFERWITKLFWGTPRDQVLALMPQSDPESIKRMFMFFGFSLIIGFIINSLGLIINIINEFTLKRPGKALFGTTSLSGAVFFWYVIVMVVRIAFFKHSIAVYDWIVIAVTMAITAGGEVLSRLVDGEKPAVQGEVGEFVIMYIINILEIFMTYMSNTLSFLRVGAFALAHAVLDFIILTMMNMAGGIGGLFIFIIGNVIIVGLEGMIVAIQGIRLEYYEFFSKFFSENGKEFKPYRFRYGENE